MTKWFLLISLIGLQGCSTIGNLFGQTAVPEVKPVEVITITEPAPMYHPPLPEAVVAAIVEWTILNPSVMREYFSDVKRYIRQILNIIKYYRDNDPTKKDELKPENE